MSESARVPSERPSARLRTIMTHLEPARLQERARPFSPGLVEEYFDPAHYAFLELKEGDRAYSLACAYIAMNGDVNSFQYQPSFSGDESQIEEATSLTTIGLGVFPFKWQKHSFYALHQTLGSPVGTQCCASLYTTLVLFSPIETADTLGHFCADIIAMSERTQAGCVNVFEWSPLGGFWQLRATSKSRTLDSVVLDHELKDRLVTDVLDFLADDTRAWYAEHGIPHKRGYLFYGVPGSGKTSLIRAMAGQFQHNIGYLHLSHPQLTDDSLKQAVNEAPKRSLLVLEDVDAVFGPAREKLMENSFLTFSGLLNALDGVGKEDGQIFILTTNYRERLNHALIRNGRVDVHIEFTYATNEQLSLMFKRFYPCSSEHLADHFVNATRAKLNGRQVSTAALQHFFILHRKSTAKDAIEHVGDIVTELNSREDEQRWSENVAAERESMLSNIRTPSHTME